MNINSMCLFIPQGFHLVRLLFVLLYHLIKCTGGLYLYHILLRYPTFKNLNKHIYTIFLSLKRKMEKGKEDEEVTP